MKKILVVAVSCLVFMCGTSLADSDNSDWNRSIEINGVETFDTSPLFCEVVRSAGRTMAERGYDLPDVYKDFASDCDLSS